MQYQTNYFVSYFVKREYKTIMMQTASILGRSTVAVKKEFPHHLIHIIPDPLNIDKELLEMKFKSTTVTYVINHQDICTTGYLFLNNTLDLENYLTVCKKYFDTVASNSWKYKSCYIELLKEGDSFYFLFY